MKRKLKINLLACRFSLSVELEVDEYVLARRMGPSNICR